MIAKEQKKCQAMKKNKIIAVFFGFVRRGPGHFDGLRSTVEGCYELFNLAAVADQPQTRTRRTCQLLPFQKRCVTHSQLVYSNRAFTTM